MAPSPSLTTHFSVPPPLHHPVPPLHSSNSPSFSSPPPTLVGAPPLGPESLFSRYSSPIPPSPKKELENSPTVYPPHAENGKRRKTPYETSNTNILGNLNTAPITPSFPTSPSIPSIPTRSSSSSTNEKPKAARDLSTGLKECSRKLGEFLKKRQTITQEELSSYVVSQLLNEQPKQFGESDQEKVFEE